MKIYSEDDIKKIKEYNPDKSLKIEMVNGVISDTEFKEILKVFILPEITADVIITNVGYIGIPKEVDSNIEYDYYSMFDYMNNKTFKDIEVYHGDIEHYEIDVNPLNYRIINFVSPGKFVINKVFSSDENSYFIAPTDMKIEYNNNTYEVKKNGLIEIPNTDLLTDFDGSYLKFTKLYIPARTAFKYDVKRLTPSLDPSFKLFINNNATEYSDFDFIEIPATNNAITGDTDSRAYTEVRIESNYDGYLEVR